MPVPVMGKTNLYFDLTVLFPHMSRLAADGDLVKLKSILSHGMMCIAAIMVPVSIGVIVLAQPGGRILFRRGSFTAEDTVRTASCLSMYALLIAAKQTVL